MSAARLISPFGTNNHQRLLGTSSINKNICSDLSTINYQRRLAGNHVLLSTISFNIMAQSRMSAIKIFFVCNSNQAGVPVPSANLSSSWKGWILGMLLSIVLPFWRNKLGPLQVLKNEVAMVLETVEFVSDVVEKVAEEVENVAEEVSNKLPEGGKLRRVVEFIKNIAKEITKDAHLVEQLIDKVEKVKKQVESFIEPVIGQVNPIQNR